MGLVNNLEGEEWKPVFKHDNRWRELFGEDEKTEFEVSSFGRLRKGNYLIQPQLDISGYYGGYIEGLYRSVHRLVAEAFLWNSVRKHSRRENVHHINENKQDNRVSNLMFCSKAQHGMLHLKQSAERNIVKLQKKLESNRILPKTRRLAEIEMLIQQESLEYSLKRLQVLAKFD